MSALFPKSLDVFLTLIDGFHPIAAVDRQLIGDAIQAIQTALGTGVNRTAGSTTYGPKGGNTSVAARIAAFLDPDGGLKDIAFVTGSSAVGEWTDQGGAAGKVIDFGKTLSASDYSVLMTFETDAGGSSWSTAVPCLWHVGLRGTDTVAIKARGVAGDLLYAADQTTVRYACLAIGAQAYYA